MNKRIILNISIMIIVILSLLTFPIVIAIYKYKVNSSGDVGLAEWSVTLNQSGVENHLSIISEPNVFTASYTVNVTSQSQVDVIYSIVINNLPSGVSVAIDNNSTFIQENNGKVTFPDVGIILYNDNNKNKSHVLTFKASTTTPYLTDQEVNVNVVAKQVIPTTS